MAKKSKEAEIKELWRDYKKEKNPKRKDDLRDRLVLNYAPLVKFTAGKISSRLPANVETADLISYGMFGLIDAIEKFDLKRKVKFETYALARIRGAIIDELRKLDWVPRSVRHKSRLFEKAYIELFNKLKRVPTDRELARSLDISLKELYALLNKISQTSQIALDELWEVGDEDKGERVGLLSFLEDKSAEEPSFAIEAEERKKVLLGAIDELTERERNIIVLYYYKGFSLKEIAEIMGLTESRVSQLHTKALLHLKGSLSAKKSLLILS